MDTSLYKRVLVGVHFCDIVAILEEMVDLDMGTLGFISTWGDMGSS